MRLAALSMRVLNQKYLRLGLKLIMGYVGLTAMLTAVSLVLTFFSLRRVSQLEFKDGARIASFGRQTLRATDLLLFNQLSLMQAWKETLLIVEEIPQIQGNLEQSLLTAQINQTSLVSPELIQSLNQVNRSVQIIHSFVNDSPLVISMIGDPTTRQLNEVADLLPGFIQMMEKIAGEDINWVILLKNNEELRAGGGFIGSIVSLSTYQGEMSEPVFYDVYDLSNRIQPLSQPPVGVGKYLSEGKGLALTDANWEADFTQSSPIILELLDQTQLPKTDVLIAVNLSLIQDLLKIIGPLKLIDTDQEVNAQNLSYLARQNRLNFFAGDKQKKMFLSQLYQTLKLDLGDLESSEQFRLIGLLLKAIEQKQVLAYSPDSKTQNLIHNVGASGAIDYESDYFLYLVESNVGINKANQAISRSVMIEFQPETVKAVIDFDNNNLPLSTQEKEAIQSNPDLNQADHLGYVNYQRVVTNLPFEKVQIGCNGDSIEPEEISQIKVKQGFASQIGFLLTVAEQNKTSCSVIIKPSILIKPNQSVTVVRQPGLPSTEYLVQFFDQELKFTLKQDILFKRGQ